MINFYEGQPKSINQNLPIPEENKERISQLAEELKKYEAEEGDEAIAKCIEIYNELDELDPDFLENLKK